MRVCFDATVLCGGLIRPTGQNARLLAFAADSPLLDGFTTDVVGLEFVRNALDGISGNVYELDEMEEFLDFSSRCRSRERRHQSPPDRALARAANGPSRQADRRGCV